jgi:hypothetical protein
LPFVYAADPRQRSISQVQVPWDSWSYFTVSNLRLPFSSPPTTCRATVEVFEPTSTRVTPPPVWVLCYDLGQSASLAWNKSPI